MIPPHSPAAQELLERGRKHRILGKIAACLEAAREGQLVTARELIKEAADLLDLEMEDG